MNDIQLTYSPHRIVESIANINIPPNVLRQSNIKNIIPDINQSQTEVKNSVDKLERLRQEQKDGNFISNWWNDRDDHVKDAQIDLNKSIGKLTEKTSTLLVINTAMAKQLHDQQNILLQQQKLLEQQTRDLKSQNNQISEQQKVLEKQQREINLANQGLMEAKGITQEQAMQLVGCVKIVKEAESRIDAANHTLRSDVRQDLRDSIEQYAERLNNGFTEQAKRHTLFEQKITTNFSVQEQQVQKSLEQIIAESALHKTAVQEQLNAAITTLKQHSETLEKKLNLFEQQVAANFSAQAQETQKSLKQLITESALQKTAVQEQLDMAITTIKQHGETLEQQLNNSLFTQSQHTKTELTRFSNDSSEFKTNIEQQLHSHMQTILEKISIQNSINKQLNDTFSGLEAIQSQQTQAQKASEYQLATLLVNYQKSASGNRLAIAVTAILAITSFGWQVAQYFVLN